jgi:TRAP-type C4-dicarboxylate transport system permease large subunit
MKMILTCAALALFVGNAEAQQACNSRSVIVKMLGEKYHEQAIGGGRANQALIEVFVSPEGSFTVIASYPNGIACLIAGGYDWKHFEKPKAGKRA